MSGWVVRSGVTIHAERVMMHLGGFIDDTVADGDAHQIDANHVWSSKLKERGRGEGGRGMSEM